MLVVVGQVVQEGQLVHIRAVPTIGPPVYSVVRLEALNEAAMSGVKLISGSALLDPFVGVVRYGELNPPRVAGRTPRRNAARRLPSQLVESRSESPGNVGDGVDEVLGEVKERRKLIDAKAVVAGLWIEVGPEHSLVTWVGERFGDVSFQGGQVTMAPLELTDSRSEKGV
jgi:hypothetical protein